MARCQRRLRQRVAEFVLAPERLGHHRQAQQTQHVLFAGLAEVNTHGQRRDGLHGGAFIKQAKLRHPSVINLLKVNATSRAVIGVPSWKRACGLSAISIQE